MLKKYSHHFKEMHQEIRNGEGALEVISRRLPLFADEGIGALGIAGYLCKYAQEKEL